VCLCGRDKEGEEMMGVNIIESDSPVYRKWKRHVLTRVKSAKCVIIKILCSLHTTSIFVALNVCFLYCIEVLQSLMQGLR
jgi:hypothetical protein